MASTARKRNGVHYTPGSLARFLAKQVTLAYEQSRAKFDSKIRVLDPACGDGELLAAFVDAWGGNVEQLVLTGFDRDGQAVNVASERLSELGVGSFEIQHADFLEEFDSGPSPSFDIVIANPPYVRTQVLGGSIAQKLAKRFDLKGRVDLYQAFSIAMSHALTDGGVLGLLTSNRFLSVKSGMSLRHFLASNFKIHQVFDLGDTRLFEAAVLPAIITAVKSKTCNDQVSNSDVAAFHRVYAVSNAAAGDAGENCVLEMLGDPNVSGRIDARQGVFSIERGGLDFGKDVGQPWSLTNASRTQWIRQLRDTQHCTFGDLAEIKVGIKTTADKVFIRQSWESLPDLSCPESVLLHPLLTHHDAVRWKGPTETQKVVFYPFLDRPGQRQAIELSDFPGAERYLTAHREQLESRKYVVDSGRKWFEIWVPHQPAAWSKEKLVWPDISENPKFFLDSTGAIVNGDCYWLTLKPQVEQDWLYLMLGVANSKVATTFYDGKFHNKLYAGRRRFMTQYVKDFPLPDLNRQVSTRIVEWVKNKIANPEAGSEHDLETMVSACFGFDDLSTA